MGSYIFIVIFNLVASGVNVYAMKVQYKSDRKINMLSATAALVCFLIAIFMSIKYLL